MVPQLVRVAPTVTAGAYDANDVVGGILTFSGATRGILRAVTITDLAKQAGAYQLILFDTSPTAIADNAPYDLADDDLNNIIAAVHIADTAGADKFDFADSKAYCKGNINIPLRRADGGTAIYGFLIALGTPTYAAVTDVTVMLHIEA